ncbi:hypothetical protein VTN77DRAFT_8769 [Rasamsonia byssochlamydoides]|uniref:uncharacterized protein n=1 Tax=Rasamsonia byssochlamydoides TaxID=89139 RepID=UPI0037429AEE
MRFSGITLITAAASLARLASAVGNATVINNCANDIYLWSVDSTIGPEQTVAAGQSYTEQIHTDPISGGVAIKLTLTADGMYNGSPQTDFAYTLQDTQVWYDLSDVYGDPFAGKSVALVPSDTSCQSIVWSDGVPPAGNPTTVCESGTDLVLTVC